MTWSETAFAVSALLLLALWWFWVAASRLDRLHRKVATSRAALDNQLVRRASAAAELAASGLLDPVSSVLVGEAARVALSAGAHGRADLVAALPDLSTAVPVVPSEQVLGPAAVGAVLGGAERDMAESDLSRTVRTALADVEEVRALRHDPVGDELVGAVAAAWYRVQLARRFHNEAVAQTQRMRRKPLVRMLHMSGRAPMPRTVEIDDGWPEAFAEPGVTT